MEMPDLNEMTCSGCGAKLTPGMRYCLSCYRPIDSQGVSQAHSGLAGQLSTTRRPDPAIIFRPDVHEAMVRKRARQKRALKLSAVAVVLIIIGSVAWWRIAIARRKVQDIQRRQQLAASELNMMADGFERFKRDVGRYPTTDEGIPALLNRPLASRPGDPGRLEKWSGPYMTGDFEVDPWGADYVYQGNDGGASFTVFSWGPGGEDAGRVTIAVSSGQSAK